LVPSEFVPLLNAAVHAWQTSLQATPSVPRLISVHLAGSAIQMAISNLSPAFVYRLQRSTNLAPGSWRDALVMTGCAFNNWSEPVLPNPGGVFYRVRIP
jgi:hypothetical protein